MDMVPQCYRGIDNSVVSRPLLIDRPVSIVLEHVSDNLFPFYIYDHAIIVAAINVFFSLAQNRLVNG